jgi:iron complex outermembrane receptor protein
MIVVKFVAISSFLALSVAQAHACEAADVAASVDAGADTESGMSGDIVVTAQKREQRITDVPMAISAYGAGFLEQVGGNELSRVAAITPGFVVQLQDKFAPGFSIRGITSNDFSPQAELRVAVFQDGVPVTQATASYSELFDIDRIEVEKGPQSTLHGRSALNGGVSIFQKRPTDLFSLEARGSLGTYHYYSGQVVINAPVGETLALRMGALVRKRAGFVKDSDGDGSYNALNAQAYRFAARWTPSDRFQFNLIATFDRDNTKGGVPFKSRTFLPLDQTSGQVTGDLDFWTPTHLNSFGPIPAAYFNRKILNISGTADWTINDKLSLTSITGYRWSDAAQSGDNDGTPTNIIAYEQRNYSHQASEELRLNIKDVGPVEGFVGVSAFNAKNGMNFDLGYDERAMALLLRGTLQQFAPKGLTNTQINALLGPAASALKPFHMDEQLTHADITTYDMFGDFTVHVAPKLEIFAGGRVTFDSKDVSVQGLTPYGKSTLTGGSLLLPITPNGSVKSDSNSSTVLTGRAGVRYAASPQINLYAVYGVGKRPEVLQVNANKANETIPAETLKSAEAGVKYRLLDGRLIGDMSVYHYDYSNFQTLGVVGGALATINAGKADATGFETQASFILVKGVTLFGSYGLNHARFRAGAYEGNRFRNSPDHKLAIGADFSADVKGGRVSFAPLYSWQSKMFFDDNNDRLDLQKRTPVAYSDKAVDEFQNAFGLLSARLSFAGDGERWTFALIGDNLTDKKFIVDAGNIGDNFGIPTFIAGTRRSCRAEFSIKF